MIVNKGILVQKFREKNGLTIQKSTQLITSLMDIIIQELYEGNGVILTNIGTLKHIQKKSRKAKNPATKQDMIVPSRMHIRMKLSKAMASFLKTMPLLKQ